jgi:hypothetical protein
MRRQLSNEFPYLIPLQYSAIVVTVEIIVLLFTGFPSVIGGIFLIAILIIAILYDLFLQIRLYKVSFDHDYLYCFRYNQEKIIPLENVGEITPGALPYSIFYHKCYMVVINYYDGDSKRKIHFLSRGRFWRVTNQDIPLLATLRDFVMKKKYGSQHPA